MMHRAWKRMVLIGCVFAVAGCQRLEEPCSRTTSRVPGPPVLLLPAFGGGGDTGDAVAAMDGFLRRECVARFGNRLVAARDVAALRDALTEQNLHRNGRFSHKEIAAMAQIAECAQAVSFELAASDPYPPQHLSGVLTVVHAASAEILFETAVELDLANPDCLRAYTEYLERQRNFRIGNHESRPSDRMHTAFLSPSMFRRFAAHSLAERLVHGTAPAYKRTCRHLSASETQGE